MIPKYVLEGMSQGTSIIYGHGLGDSHLPGRDVTFYSGEFSKINDNGNVVVTPTDPRLCANLTSLDQETDFLFNFDRDMFLEKPWASEMRILLRSELKGNDLANPRILMAVESALNQFIEISRNRSRFYSERDVVEIV